MRDKAAVEQMTLGLTGQIHTKLGDSHSLQDQSSVHGTVSDLGCVFSAFPGSGFGRLSQCWPSTLWLVGLIFRRALLVFRSGVFHSREW